MMTLLIIDVSVARASGDVKAKNPNAVACRDTLIAIGENLNINLLMTNEILAEWYKIDEKLDRTYASRFAISWLAQMRSKRRIVHTETLNVNEFNQCAEKHLTPYKLGELRKDMHLFFAALNNDKKIISCDNFCWQYAIELKFCFPRVLQLHWVNPNDIYCLEWIRAGANDDPHWRPKDE